jgi:deazaflavin-dependent oxidoreductase (nitroreductase family)
VADKLRKPKQPKGLSRLLYRLPIILYRLGLGHLMGGRFLLLEHQGRKTGLVRRAVLEIIRHDPTVGVYYVVSGFSERADWFRNIKRNPDVQIQVGKKAHSAIAVILDGERASAEVLDYAERNPTLIKLLAKSLLGYQLGDEKEDLLEFARHLQVVRFHILFEGSK